VWSTNADIKVKPDLFKETITKGAAKHGIQKPKLTKQNPKNRQKPDYDNEK